VIIPLDNRHTRQGLVGRLDLSLTDSFCFQILLQLLQPKLYGSGIGYFWLPNFTCLVSSGTQRYFSGARCSKPKLAPIASVQKRSEAQGL